jgi:hypothetical protein
MKKNKNITVNRRNMKRVRGNQIAALKAFY